MNLENYLNEIVKHVITRSTPYFEEIFKVPEENVVRWIQSYKSFEGVRSGKNVEIVLQTKEGNENIEESPERRNVGLQMSKNRNLESINSFVNQMKRIPVPKEVRKELDLPKTKKIKKKVRHKVDKKNAISKYASFLIVIVFIRMKS